MRMKPTLNVVHAKIREVRGENCGRPSTVPGLSSSNPPRPHPDSFESSESVSPSEALQELGRQVNEWRLLGRFLKDTYLPGQKFANLMTRIVRFLFSSISQAG
jgi:hypothetical protein